MISSALSWRKWKKKCGAGEVPFRRAAGIPRCRRSVTGFAIRIIVFLPPSPRPPSRREGGDSKFSYARGFAPCIPGGCTHGSPRKRQEAVPYEQCRQPRRGGTGGDGTIRRKRRRRLRWSSPPGQGEPVPLGGQNPPPVQSTGGGGSADHKILSPAGASDARQAQPGEQATQATQAEHCRQAPSGIRHRTP